jgi:uncharacterized protein YndB with AHSA1/START domain
MGHLQKHGVIDAPPATVYRYVADVRHAPQFISAITRITSGPAGPAVVGHQYGADATFMGQPAALTLRVLELAPDHTVKLALEGDPAAILTLRLTPARNGQATRVDARLDVPAVPGLLLQMVMGGMLDQSMTRLEQALR